MLKLTYPSLKSGILFFFCLTAISFAQPMLMPADQNLENEGKIISKITLENSVKYTLKKMNAVLDIEVGDPYSSSQIRESFKNIYDLGVFENLIFYISPLNDNSLELIIYIEEYNTIKSIEFTGNKKFQPEEFTETLNIQIGDYFSQSALNRAITLLKEKYREDGYLTTKVTPTLKVNNELKEVEIVFEIEEGAEILVGEIKFIGSSQVKAKEIEREMETKVDKWFREGKFDDSVFENDLIKIIQLYKKKGYINAKILRTSRTYRWRDPNKKKTRDINLTISLEEGEQFFFGSITIKGNRLFKTEELTTVIQRKEGEVYNQEIHEMEIQSISSKYQERGYIFSRVTPIENIDKETRKISFILDIYEGDKAHVEKISISGNEETKDYVIQRELLLKEGEIFNADKVRQSAENLMRTGYFNNVIPSPKQGSIEGLMNLDFNVEEAQTGMIQAGASLGTESGAGLNFDFSKKNLFGRGHTLALKVNVAQNNNIASVSFTEPWLFGLPISLSGSIWVSSDINRNPLQSIISYSTDKTNGAIIKTTNSSDYILLKEYNSRDKKWYTTNSDHLKYTTLSLSTSIRVGYRFFNNWYLVSSALTLAKEKKEYSDWLAFWENRDKNLTQKDIYELNKNRNLQLVINGNVEDTLTWSFDFERNTINNVLHPTRGSQAEYHFEYKFGDLNVIKHNTKFAIYKRLFWKAALAYRFDAYSWAPTPTWFNKIGRPDENEYYFLNEELRGWDSSVVNHFYKTRKVDNWLNGQTGKGKLKHTLEARIPLGVDMLVGVAYLDWGSLSKGYLYKDYKSLYHPGLFMGSFGVGLAVNLSMFPVRLYLGYRFHYDENTKSLKLYIDETNGADSYFSGSSKIPRPKFIFTVAGFF